jgi:hypothetical protein
MIPPIRPKVKPLGSVADPAGPSHGDGEALKSEHISSKIVEEMLKAQRRWITLDNSNSS